MCCWQAGKNLELKPCVQAAGPLLLLAVGHVEQIVLEFEQIQLPASASSSAQLSRATRGFSLVNWSDWLVLCYEPRLTSCFPLPRSWWRPSLLWLTQDREYVEVYY